MNYTDRQMCIQAVYKLHQHLCCPRDHHRLYPMPVCCKSPLYPHEHCCLLEVWYLRCYKQLPKNQHNESIVYVVLSNRSTILTLTGNSNILTVGTIVNTNGASWTIEEWALSTNTLQIIQNDQSCSLTKTSAASSSSTCFHRNNYSGCNNIKRW